jgi:hypothetical protein
MPPPSLPHEPDDVDRALQALEQRVARIEEHLGLAAAPARAPVSQEPALAAFREGASAVPILGRMLLGLAGAYVLRALTDARTVPHNVGVFAAILYSILWLVLAARTSAARRTQTALYSLTSALVLGPLLWEATIRLHVLGPWASAAVLFVFTLFGLIVSWRKNLLIVATTATLTGVLTSIVLLVGTEDVAPFLIVLLAIAAAVEVSACLEHWLNERWLTALAADLAVLIATYLVTNANGLPETYAPIPHGALLASQMALLVIYFSSTLFRTLFRGHSLNIFETAQLALAFLIAIGGGLRLGAEPHILGGMTIVSLSSAAACYWLAFAERGRNFVIYSAYGFLLSIAGTLIALSYPVSAAIWSVLAIACLAAGRFGLSWYAVLYLLSALVASEAFDDATRSILGGADTHVALVPVFSVTIVAVASYFLALRNSPNRILHVIFAGFAFWLLAGTAAAVLTGAYHQFFGAVAPHAYCGTLRTGVLAGGAVLLAFAILVWKRAELRPLIFVAMGFGAYRLLLVDLRQDVKPALVLSLFAYGAALIFLPRLMQHGRAPGA